MSVVPIPPLSERPFCSIVIPCRNEEAFIARAIAGALSQGYPPACVEVLVVDGGSIDGTRAIVERLAEEEPRLHLLHNPGRIQSAGMNVGLARAKGELICRMDAHADYAPDYLEASVRVLKRTGAWNVGGAARARSRGGFQDVVCAALGSVLGFGGSAYRDPSREGFVESVFNGTFRREAFERAGLYDEEAVTNEDAELNQRILAAGGSIYLSREVVVHYYPRESPRALGRQYFAYGMGRARTFLTHGRLPSWRPVVPFFGVGGLTLLGASALLSGQGRHAFFASLCLYGALLLAEALRVGAGQGPLFCLQVTRALALMHLAHGLGFARGLLRHGPRTRLTRPHRVEGP